MIRFTVSIEFYCLQVIKIAHIVNPVKISEKHDLFKAQPITFASMENAKKFSALGNDIVLCSTQFEEDKSIIPDFFQKLSNLDKSVLDINPTLQGQKLPLINDILSKLNEIPDADYYIYTNVDIALMPQFYDAVFKYISQGNDAIIINRRRLSNHYQSIEELPLMYSDLGKSHPGFDCFVFHKSLLPKLTLGNICVGVPFLEASLVHNLFSFATNPILIDDAHLTFHIGMTVLSDRSNDFYKHNRNEYFNTIQPLLKPHFSIKKFPYASLPVYLRAIKWILNPSLFTRNYLELEGKNIFQNLKTRLDEIRWRILQR